jgi:hypothetical protein
MPVLAGTHSGSDDYAPRCDRVTAGAVVRWPHHPLPGGTEHQIANVGPPLRRAGINQPGSPWQSGQLPVSSLSVMMTALFGRYAY